MINVGIIGCGKIAALRHAPEFSANNGCRLVGFYDFVPFRAQALADQFDAKAFGSMQCLIDNVDAVSICTANNAHAAATIQALNCGRHVLCEKPMATTLKDCEDMAQAARAAGRVLMLGHDQLFMPVHQKARALIAAGAIGRPITFRTTFAHAGPESWTGTGNTWFFDKRRAAMGALGDLGIHKTDLIRFLLGEDIVRVNAVTATLNKTYPDGSPITVDDNAVCIYEMESGATGTMQVSWTSYGMAEDNSTRICGTEGTLHIMEDPALPLILETKDGARECWPPDALLPMEAHRIGTGVIDAFLSAVDGEPSPADSTSALRSMRAIFAAEESALTGRAITIRHYNHEEEYQ
ncbi:MAG: Gfo/Idh/MocA family oxidoreductase [Clostridiales bacterium]|nr:Gfo/Idh/MocA family oxidoreductase [Clostridiales bacterium]